MKRFVLVLTPVVLLAACGKGEPEPTSSAFDAVIATAHAAEAAPAAKAVKFAVETPRYSFDFAYPAAAAAIPALKARLDAERAKDQADIAAQAREGAQQAKADGFDFNPYSRSIVYSKVTELPGWLSMNGQYSDFTGGAHGNSGSSALLWDKAAGTVREPVSLFVSKAAFDAVLGPALCAAINKERTVRRGAPVEAGSGDDFEECPAPSSLTVLLGSANRMQFTRIGFIADPYVAGPYSEGSYEVTLPVTPALLKVVKPEYRAAFAGGR